MVSNTWGVTWSAMEGRAILGTEGYNGLSTVLLASVSTLSVQNGTWGKESS